MRRSAARNQAVVQRTEPRVGRVVEPGEAPEGRNIVRVDWRGGRQRGEWIPGRREAVLREAATRELRPTLLDEAFRFRD